MHATELTGKLKSKVDFMMYLDNHCKSQSNFWILSTSYLIVQYYLPDENVVNKDFLKDVLSGKKALMKKADVIKITVPHYDELSVKALWPHLSKDAEFMQYFPDKFPPGRGPPRKYFFDILNTL